VTTASASVGRPPGSLLLCCLGIRRNGSASQRPPALTADDVTEILRQAGDNGISPLLYERLMTVAPAPELPASALEHLRGIAVRSAARSLRIGRELAEILELFRRAGIPVIALKGAHLGQIVYPSMALRTMGDLDLMVRRDQLPMAEDLLGQLGYVPQHDPLEQVDYAHHHHTRPLGKPGAVRIDLHWSIARPTAPFAVDIEGIWERAVPARLAGVEALVLSPEDLILHLCLHASFDHQFRLGLRACWDILEVLRHHRGSIDWDQLGRRARQWGIGRYVYVTLRLVRELLAADIPPAAIASLEPADFPPAVVEWASRSIFTAESAVLLSPSLGRLWTSRRLGAKVGVLLESMCPPRLAMARIYRLSPRSRWIHLYYPLRWVDLLVRYGRHTWGLWRGDHRTHDELRAVSERAALNDWLGAPVSEEPARGSVATGPQH
jgi:putative nucleotidyltransferase-like protein